jgi:hypothetical protein
MGHGINLSRRMAAESLGAFALVFAGCGAIVTNAHTHGALGAVGVSLVFGLVILAGIAALGHISGAHFNPAVTLSFFLTPIFPVVTPSHTSLDSSSARRSRLYCFGRSGRGNQPTSARPYRASPPVEL